MRNSIRNAILFIVILAVLCLSGCGKASEYEQAMAALESGDYAVAVEAFEALGNYEDSREQAAEARLLAEKQADYENALSLSASGSCDEAAELFLSLGDYLDSARLAAECRQQALEASYAEAVSLFNAGDHEKAKSLFLLNPEYKNSGLYLKAIDLADCKAGDRVSFGSYPQDRSGSPAPIQWQILRAEEGRLLLLSELGLDSMRFHKDLYPFWADSELRQWLNGSFLTSAFTGDEQQLIQVSAIETPGYYSELGLYMGGPDTEDKVFLLSKEELREYLPEDADRLCLPSEYALSAGAGTDEDGHCFWWTRSPGNHHGKICVINPNGYLDPDGRVLYTYICLRPAVWVNIRNLTLE